MPDPSTCAHEDLSIGANVEQSEGFGKRWLNAKLSVRCDTCGVLFSWSGVGSGLPNPYEPVVSADGYELRAPIQPKPGATVGMLVSAGLEDRLLHPLAVSGETTLPGGAESASE